MTAGELAIRRIRDRVRPGIIALTLAALLSSCGPPQQEPVIGAALRGRSQQPAADAARCAECHAEIVARWAGSQHAQANRLVSDELDRPAFTPPATIAHGSFTTARRRSPRGDYLFTTTFSNQPAETYRAEAVIGITPLRQYLVTYPGGRLQAMDIAFDPRSNDWFNVFGDENRQPHEWGHWKGRSMTWNVQCAFCHMTGFEKHYDPATDRYASTWQAMGISCSQCHVASDQLSVKSDQTKTCTGLAPGKGWQPASTNAAMDNCGSCHARREELFGTFQPGAAFHDHYRLTLPDQPGIYHADGQVREEDFEFGSFLMSRMHLKGVTCLDCHDPHSGQLKAPVENNALCLQCHTPPGLRGAIPIDPAAHSFHKPEGAGNLCVGCHMPQNFYMVRDARRDHGFTSPDPRLTIELGIPNACNKCHADKTAEWSEGFTTQWYGDKMNRRSRDRARVIARAQAGDETVVTALLAMAVSEEIPAWQAALGSLLAPWSTQSAIAEFLQAQLTNNSPLVRSAAVRALQVNPGVYEQLKPLRTDPSALVRVDAAWATLNPLERDPKSYNELLDYLQNIADQPAGTLRNADFELRNNRGQEAENWARKALAWDPSPVPHHVLGRIQHINGNLPAAVSNLTQAAVLATNQADYSYTLALLLAETGDRPGARLWLEETVRREPSFGRAWYNLGLAYAALEQLQAAAAALEKAEVLLPHSEEVPYALATVYLRDNRPADARNAVGRCLQRSPGYRPALELLARMPE